MIEVENEPFFRLAQKSDKDAVLTLLNNVFDEQQRSSTLRGDRYWDWKFNDNPYGKPFLIVFEIRDKIVGVANLWPWEFTCRGQTIKALQPSDAAVMQEYRGNGLFKKSRLYAIDLAKYKEYQLIFNFPNKNSLPVYESLGWDYLGRVSWWVKILKPINLVKGYFSKDKATASEIDVEYLVDTTFLDGIVDKSPSFDGYLKVNRVKGFHKWRYADRPNRSYGMVVYEGNRKTTAAVFTINQNNNNREMVIVDIVGAPTNLVPLFKKINGVAKKSNVDFIAVMENPHFQTKTLLKLGYFKKRSKNMVVLPLDIGLEEKVTSFSSWSLVAGMHDSI